MRLGMLTAWSMMLASAGLVAQSCGDDEVVKNDATDVPLFDSGGELPDIPGGDSASPSDSSLADSTQQPVDSTTNPPDLVPDMTPPAVVSTTPAAGAEGVTLPLEIKIVFDEAVFGNSIAPQSIKLFDWTGKEVPGTPKLEPDGKTVTWKPTANDQQLASAYTITVMSGIVSDLAGNRLMQKLEYTFKTVTYPSQEEYATLAAKYAPKVHSAIAAGTTTPQFAVPTKLDGDGDWNLANNRQWILSGATQVLPAVYYSVTESFTHYFIHYALYFPYVNHPTGTLNHTNGMFGTMVVVEKAAGAQVERPIVAYNYWKEGDREEMYSFATEESNIAKDAESPPNWGVVAEFPQATLFPDGHLQLYVVWGSHRTCLWGWDDGAALPTCEFNSGVENGDQLVFEYLGNSANALVKGDNGWPTDMEDIEGAPSALGYTLVPIFNSIWPRRAEMGETEIFEVTTPFTYEADTNRPGGGLKLNGKFLQTLTGVDGTAFGNPVWAWKWAAASGGGTGLSGTFLTEAIKKGEYALDPAFYVWERHHRTGKVNGIADYVPATNTGFALDYCFNGYLATDVRGTNPACQ